MAASAGPAKAKGRKRETIKDNLERLHDLDFDADDIQGFFREIEEAHETELDSLTFRHHGMSLIYCCLHQYPVHHLVPYTISFVPCTSNVRLRSSMIPRVFWFFDTLFSTKKRPWGLTLQMLIPLVN